MRQQASPSEQRCGMFPSVTKGGALKEQYGGESSFKPAA